MSNFISPFERIWAESSTEEGVKANSNLLVRLALHDFDLKNMTDTSNDVGVMVLVDIRPATGATHMLVVAPSYGDHNGERDITDYPETIITAFDRMSNYMNRRMRQHTGPDEVVKRLVSNKAIQTHPHAVLYTSPRSFTLSEGSERHTGPSANRVVERTIAELAFKTKSEFQTMAAYVKDGLRKESGIKARLAIPLRHTR